MPEARGKYLALFNLSDQPMEIEVTADELALVQSSFAVRDLWRRKDRGSFDRLFAPTIDPHGAGLYQVFPEAKSKTVAQP